MKETKCRDDPQRLNGAFIAQTAAPALGLDDLLVVPLMARPYALSSFGTLMDRLRVTGAARCELIRLWNEPHRHYHAAGHAGVLWHRHLAHGGDPCDAVAAHAIAYHDAVWQPGRRDNETESAALWRQHAHALPTGLRDSVERAILATVNHAEAQTDADARWLVDLDLTTLGEPWPLFQANTRALDREMTGAITDRVRAAQRAFLGRLAALPALYRSARHGSALARTYEVTARENLARALA